ncbi:MAG: MMPL family transporter [Elusimicrobia bacterium]|nr:MMPL family transporter [Elusimicrobiota bacterium]
MLRDRFVHRLANLIARHRWAALAVTAVVSGALMTQIPRLQTRTDVDVFYIPTDPFFKLSKQLEKIYRRNEFFFIVFKDDALFTPSRLTNIGAITDALENLPDVEEVISLSNVNDMRGSDDAFIVEPFLYDRPDTADGLERLKQRALGKRLYRNRLISEDGTTTAISVFLPPHSDGDLRLRVLNGVEKILAPYHERGYQFHLAGWPVVNVRLVQFMNADMGRFLPLTFLLALGTVWFVFRNIRLFFVAGAGVVLTVGATLGLAGITGITLNNASIAALPIVMALALSDLVHLFSHLDRSVLANHPDRFSALNHVLKQILFPCLLTSVNTAIGFFSFTSNRIPAVREFGWLAASGMVMEFFITFGLIAPLLLFFKTTKIYRDTEVHTQQPIPQLVRWAHETVLRRPWRILCLSLALAVWGGWQSKKVEVETDLVQYFSLRTQVRQDMEFTKRHLGGIQTMSVEFHGQRNDFKDPDRLAALARLESSLESIPSVDSVTSLVDYLRDMNMAFHGEDPAQDTLPSSRRLLEQYLLLYSADDLDEVVTPGFDRTRLSVRLRDTGSKKNGHTLALVRQTVAGAPIHGTIPSIVGGVVDIDVTARVMVGDQLRGIGQAVGTIWCVMLVVLRSVKLATLFLVPNLFPIVLNFGLMGTWDIPIDTGTALVAASAFGIIVDDTVHFFTRFSERRRHGWTYERALDDVTQEKGEAALSSSLILSLGFGVLMLGHFVPVIRYGLLNVMVLTTGMFGDMFLLKSIMALGRGRTGRTTRETPTS